MEAMDIAKINRTAWENECRLGNPWTIPVSPETIVSAREGHPSLLLTPSKTVPSSWYLPVKGRDILCLASGGGQQAPQFAAMGANVTVLDNSPSQLESDRMVASREGLSLTTVLGDMRDLSSFPDGSFSLVFHPVSNCFIDSVLPVWKECHRVLANGGALLAGFANPALYLCDDGTLDITHRIPYSDLDEDAIREKRLCDEDTIEFSHTLEEQIGGICDVGFSIVSFFSDQYDDDPFCKRIHDAFLALRAVK